MFFAIDLAYGKKGSAKEIPSGELKVVTFDDLDGGEPIIEVYRGPFDTAKDREPAGFFSGGESTVADCRVDDGRLVFSHPGEPDFEREVDPSTVWIRVVAKNYTEPRVFATIVYLKGHEAAAEGLPPCNF